MLNTRQFVLLLTAWSAAFLAPHPAATLLAQDSTRAGGKAPKSAGAKDKNNDKNKDREKSRDADGSGRRRKLEKDSVEAEQRALFASRDPLPFTLIANFNAIGKNRDSTHTERYAGTLVVRDTAGVERRIAVQLRTRGHFRLRRSTCKFVNLLVSFPGKKSELEGTPFEGQKSLKLGAHCQDSEAYEHVLRREYLSYRLFNLVSPRSFRARLATGTYLDSASSKSLGTRVAMWLEHEDDVAARQGGKIREFRRALFDDLDAGTLDQMAIFEYFIGNTDWSIYALHNVRLVVNDSGVVYPVPYDFDFSGLVNAPYATPPPQLQIRSVRDRLYRGPCRPYEVIAPQVARFAERQPELMAAVTEVPGLPRNDVRDAQEFLSVFFEIARDPRVAKQTFVDGCLKKPGA